jgi:hypothetical protein
MLTEKTQEGYKEQEIEYLEKCIRGIEEMPVVKANEIIVNQLITIPVEVKWNKKKEWNKTDQKQNIKFCLPIPSKLQPNSRLTIIPYDSSCNS